MTERLSNTLNSYIGGAKQSIGETIGSTDLAAAGAQQKAQADAAQKLVDAKRHAEGTGHKVEGQIEQKVGSATGDPQLQVTGAGKHDNHAQEEPSIATVVAICTTTTASSATSAPQGLNSRLEQLRQSREKDPESDSERRVLMWSAS